MTRYETSAAPMTPFETWVADMAIRHHAIVHAALAIAPESVSGRSAAEAELTRLKVNFIQRMHRLASLVDEWGQERFFGAPDEPLSPEQRARICDMPSGSG